MNLSGGPVASYAKFFKIKPEEILVAYDEIDLPVGAVRLKKDGGHGGHNGMRDIFAKLGSKQFYRIRLGVGHPGHKDAVADYVLKRPAKAEQPLIDAAIDKALDSLPTLLAGDPERVMNVLHTQ